MPCSMDDKQRACEEVFQLYDEECSASSSSQDGFAKKTQDSGDKVDVSLAIPRCVGGEGPALPHRNDIKM
ncbi:hypothetical protein C0J52_05522 [Blattella germanica]|nr:hypothetical protein C0J52_05522 [Blattella germanica]